MTPPGVSPGYVIAGLLVMLVVTVALRAAPFAALSRLRDSAVVRYLGLTMPAGVMVVLVVYTLRDTTLRPESWVPVASALVLTLVVHLTLRRAALSIVLGTAAYMALVALMG